MSKEARPSRLSAIIRSCHNFPSLSTSKIFVSSFKTKTVLVLREKKKWHGYPARQNMFFINCSFCSMKTHQCSHVSLQLPCWGLQSTDRVGSCFVSRRILDQPICKHPIKKAIMPKGTCSGRSRELCAYRLLPKDSSRGHFHTLNFIVHSLISGPQTFCDFFSIIKFCGETVLCN